MASRSSSAFSALWGPGAWGRLIAIVAVGIGLSGVAFAILSGAERQRVADAVDYAALDTTTEVANRLMRYSAAVAQIRALYDASDDVTRAEFDAFTATSLTEHAGVLWVAWVPAIAAGDIDALEAKARADGLRDFTVRDLLVLGTPPQADRVRRHPITYVAPTGYRAMLGVDLSSLPEWSAALAGVGPGSDVRVYELSPLFRDEAAPSLLTLVAPVYAHGEATRAPHSDATLPVGFIVAQADTAQVIPANDGGALVVQIEDASGQIVATRGPAAPHADSADAITRTLPLPLGPDTWHVKVTSTDAFAAERRTAMPWIALLVGLFITLAAGGYIHVLSRATRRATEAAAELLASSRALERETAERQLLEERVRHAQKMEAMGTLAGGIAHDFNNILSAILGYADLARNEAPTQGPLQGYLSEVAQAGRRAADLVAQILAFSRKTARERKPLRLHTVVREALKLLRGSIPSIIEIRDDIDRNCPKVTADPTEIHQIVMNLCTNAYHAMRDKGGSLVVTLRSASIGAGEVALDPRMRAGNYVRLAVSDSGHGMSPDTLRRIFEPYFTTQEPGSGTGLGLATVHGIVDDMGGVVHVYSELGHGSTFNVFFPAHEVQASDSGPTLVVPMVLEGHERILLVDDEAAIAAFAEEALGRLGYDVVALTQSPEALALFLRDPDRFDVVITDQMMPKLRGSELAHQLHAVRPDLPVILCSGFGDVLEHEQGKGRLFAACVTKPVIAADLAAAIRRVVPHDADEVPGGAPILEANA